MYLRLLGAPELHQDGVVSALPLERISWLLCLLASHADWIRREEIAELIWTDVDSDTKPRLRQLLYRANKLTRGIESQSKRLRWAGTSDVQQFRQLCQMGRELEALQLWQGELLAGIEADDSEFGAWLQLERDDLQNQRREITLRLAQHLPAQDALFWLEQLPMPDEGVLLESLRTAARTGETARGVALYRQYEKELGLLGESPSETLQAALETLVKHKTQNLVPNLPSARTPLVGREQELQTLLKLLQDQPIVSLVGIGGIGKTSLALEAARHQPHPVVFVSLAGVQAGTSLAPSILAALGLSVQQNPDTELYNALKRRDAPLLLVLDNLEQCLEAAREVVASLSELSCIRVLLTSRTRLGVRGEQIFSLEGLSLPTQSTALEASGAGAMFLAAARRQGWKPEARERAVVGRLCHLLAGTPLALELAAAWLPVLPIADIEQEIIQGLDFLSGSLADLPERQAGLRATFLYSWRLLSPAEQCGLRRLSIFRGGFSKEAALLVAQINHRDLLSLSEKSLLRLERGRLSLHELIRQYAAEQLRQEEQDWQEVAQKHAQYYLQLIERANPHLFRQAHVQWLPLLELELDNFRAALTWALTGGDVALALTLANTLSDFFHAKGLLREGANWLLASLEGHELHTPLAADAWRNLANFQLMYGELNLSTQTIQKSIAIAKALCDTNLEAWAHAVWARALNRLGQYHDMREVCLKALELPQEQGSKVACLAWLGQAEFMLGEDLESAKEHLSLALQFTRQRGSWAAICLIQQALGSIAAAQGEFETARACIREAIEVSQKMQNRFGETLHTTTLGQVELQADNFLAAKACFLRALALAQELNAVRDISHGQIQLGHIAVQQGDIAQAWQLYQEALKLARELADQRLQLEVMGGVANLYLALGDSDLAAQYLGLALLHPHTNRELARLLQHSKSALVHLQDAQRRGLERGLDQSVSLLLASSLSLQQREVF
ncbi:MAG: ATP-binding protein [Deinococcales bacterium]